MLKKRVCGLRRANIERGRHEHGQAAVEFALTFPLFLGVLLGLALFAWLFYSYVTVVLAAREGASALVHNPRLTSAEIQQVVRDKGISLDRNGLTILVEPDSITNRVPGTKISVTARYVVPLPQISIPNFRGPAFTLTAPIPVTAQSAMTIE